MNLNTHLLLSGALAFVGLTTAFGQARVEAKHGEFEATHAESAGIETPSVAAATPSEPSSAVVLETLWSEDFADGLDAWTIETFEPTDTILWVYSTSDTVEAGPALVGFDKGLTTGANGHALISFDSYRTVDTASGGIAQSLVSPVITELAELTSGEDYVVLSFDQFYAYLPVQSGYVRFSSDNGRTYGEPIVINPGLPDNTAISDAVSIPVPDDIVGQDSVRISFDYNGALYTLAVDDITLSTEARPIAPFITFDFANGIDDWTIITTDPEEEEIWEYETEIDLGAENFIDYLDFAAPSADNGFLFFDYDKAVTLVQPDSFEIPPGPPYPILTQSIVSPAFSTQRGGIDTLLVLEFYQYFQALNENAAKVSFKLEGEEGIGTEVPVEANPRFLAFDEADGFKRVVIPERFLDRDDVQIVFTYDGDFYLWAIDDISVIPAPYNTDIQLRENFYAIAPNYATPATQVRGEVQFLVDVLNAGFVTDTFNVVAAVYEATEEGGLGNLVFTDTLLYNGVSPDSLAENQLFDEAFPLPTEVGSYIGVYSVNNFDATEEDFIPEDNQLAFRFEITTDTYRKSPPGSVNGYRSVDDDVDGNLSYEAGNIYYMADSEDVTVDSVTFRGYNRDFTAENITDVEFEVFVYGAFGDSDFDNVVDPSELEELSSQFVSLDTNYLGGAGDARDVVVRFEEPVDVSGYPAFGVSVVYREPQGTEGIFFIGVGDALGAANFILSSEDFPNSDSSYVSAFSNELFTDAPEPVYSSIGPDGRGHNIAAFISSPEIDAMDPDTGSTSVTAILAEQELSARPNPASTSIYLDYDFASSSVDALIEVTNAVGQTIMQRREQSLGEGTLSLSTEDWNNGLYYVRVTTSDDRVAIRRVYVSK